jgi:hypothetical protein
MNEQRFVTPEPVRLEIKVAGGDIEIASVDAGESFLSLEGSQKLVDATTVELVGNRLIVSQRRKLFAALHEPFDGELHVRVQVPHGSRVELATASADAALDGSFAGLEANTASGNIRVTGELDGDAAVNTVSGDTHLPHVSGDLSVKTVSGDVDADSVDGSVTVRSVSGDFRVGSLREGTVSVQNVSGDVLLGVAPGTNVDVDAGSASGELSSEVPLWESPGAEPGPRLVVRSKTVSGDFRVVRAS